MSKRLWLSGTHEESVDGYDLEDAGGAEKAVVDVGGAALHHRGHHPWAICSGKTLLSFITNEKSAYIFIHLGF